MKLWNVITKILYGPMYGPVLFFVMNNIMLLNNIICIHLHNHSLIGLIHSIRIATELLTQYIYIATFLTLFFFGVFFILVVYYNIVAVLSYFNVSYVYSINLTMYKPVYGVMNIIQMNIFVTVTFNIIILL